MNDGGIKMLTPSVVVGITMVGAISATNAKSIMTQPSHNVQGGKACTALKNAAKALVLN